MCCVTTNSNYSEIFFYFIFFSGFDHTVIKSNCIRKTILEDAGRFFFFKSMNVFFEWIFQSINVSKLVLLHFISSQKIQKFSTTKAVNVLKILPVFFFIFLLLLITRRKNRKTCQILWRLNTIYFWNATRVKIIRVLL